MDFIEYCKSLKPEEWKVMITDKWNVRDVVAHMVGWEKRGVEDLIKFKENGDEGPYKGWGDKEMDEFNEQSLEYYKGYTPAELMDEWIRWQKEIEKLIAEIGADVLRNAYGMKWALENPENVEDSHYETHLKQIQKVLSR